MKRLLTFTIVLGFLTTMAFGQSLYQKFIPKGYFNEVESEKIPDAVKADAKKRMNQVRSGFEFSFLAYMDDAKNYRLIYGPYLTVTYNAAGKWMESIIEAEDEYEKLAVVADEQGYIYEEMEGIVQSWEYSNTAGSWYTIDVTNEDYESFLLITNKAFKFIKVELVE